MNNQFHFKNFEPEFQVRLEANLVMNRALELAPFGTIGIGLLEKYGEGNYCCSLDLYSKQGPFVASAVAATAEKALECLEEKVRRLVSGGRTHRRGSLPPGMIMGRSSTAAS